MSKGNSGGFSGTKGAKTSFSTFSKTVHAGKQGKHIVGHNNYTPGRSIFSGTATQAETLIKQYSGTRQKLSANRERVDFGKKIGYFADKETGEMTATTVGIIHYAKDGAHIVPARPNK